jgi:hypothetical protein
VITDPGARTCAPAPFLIILNSAERRARIQVIAEVAAAAAATATRKTLAKAGGGGILVKGP